MARDFQNADWVVKNSNGQCPSIEHALLAVLMDIRSELQEIKCLQTRTIGCYRFAEMPNTMKLIDKRLKNAGFMASPKPKGKK